MIRKPPQDWGREDPTVALARSVAATGASAMRTGTTAAKVGAGYVRAAVCLAFAALWAFAAIGAGMAGGGLPTFVGVGLMAALMAWAGLRSLAGARRGGARPTAGVTSAPRRDAIPHRGLPRQVAYSAQGLLGLVVIATVLGCGAGWAVGHAHGRVVVFAALAAPVMIAVAGAALLKLLGDRTAIAYDDARLTLSTLFGRRSLAWSEVTDIGAVTTSTYAMFGLLKVTSTERLSVTASGGLFGSARVRLAMSLLDLGPGGPPALIAELRSARARATGAAAWGSAPAPAALRPEAAASPSSSYDPDAAIARLVAERAAQRPAPTSQAYAPAGAPRAAFGRRAS